MTNYFKTKDDALKNALYFIMENRECIWSFGKAKCDCGESQSIIVDDLKHNKQICSNIICETCHNVYN